MRVTGCRVLCVCVYRRLSEPTPLAFVRYFFEANSRIAKFCCARLRTWGFAPPVQGTPSRTLTPVTLGGRRHPEGKEGIAVCDGICRGKSGCAPKTAGSCAGWNMCRKQRF